MHVGVIRLQSVGKAFDHLVFTTLKGVQDLEENDFFVIIFERSETETESQLLEGDHPPKEV